MPWLQRNPFSPASRAGLLARMEQDGCRTFSDKVRWVEEHMPNIDDAASFVGALVRKNPPDAGYENLLGEGAFSKAYAKPDLHGSFYEFDPLNASKTQIDRGPMAVETITSKQVDAGEEGWGDPEGVDASKVVTLLARDRLKGDKKALAYLPDLHFMRVDRRDAVPELVFAMPAYKPLEDLPREAVPRLTRDLGRCVDVWQTGQGTLAESAQKFLDCVRRKGDPTLDHEAPHVAKALRALHEVATSLPLTKYRADMHGGNVAVDAQGHLILLDPMVAEMNFEEAAKLLTSRAKKNPAQPELFRDSNKVTVTKGIFATHPEYADEAISLIGTAYAPIGGHANMRTRADLMADDADVYRFEDIDADLEPDVLQVSKTTPYGLKTVAMGHDGTKEAKRKAVEDKVDDFRTFGNFGEVSGALAKRVLTAGVPVVGDQRLVEKILNKKVNWVGIDPDFPGIYGWYERMLGGHMHRKILVGLPDLNKNPASPLALALAGVGALALLQANKQPTHATQSHAHKRVIRYFGDAPTILPRRAPESGRPWLHWSYSDETGWYEGAPYRTRDKAMREGELAAALEDDPRYAVQHWKGDHWEPVEVIKRPARGWGIKNPSLASELSPNQQSKYLGNLKGAAREARAAEILYRREHRSDAPFATDAGQQTKHSSHAAKFAKTYGRAPSDTADAAKLSGVSKKILDQVYARGMAAWQTGHRPGASQHAWAMARVESFLTGGPTMRGPDADLARKAGL